LEIIQKIIYVEFTREETMSDLDLLKDLKNVLYVDRIYSSLQILNSRHRNTKEREIDLATSELRLFSQNGEDGVLNTILSAIGDANNYFVEFGVGDGWSCNSRLLAEVFDWNGLFMEIDEKELSLLKQRYCNSKKIKCENAAVSPSNINQLFEKFRVPERFGVLSIDIDGQDYWVWKALDKVYQPDVVIMEYNSALDLTVPKVEKEGVTGFPLTATWGASLAAINDLAKEKGYRLVHLEMAGVNAFFVREKTIQEKQLVFNGILENRSPNFGLRGRNHSDATLYENSSRNNRPQVKF
jgi:hypothetical protein